MAVEKFGKAKEDWFTEPLGLTYGIPSHDTFGDVFAAIDTERFSECFSSWVMDLAHLTDDDPQAALPIGYCWCCGHDAIKLTKL